MEAINKNKEEIEKISEAIKDYRKVMRKVNAEKEINNLVNLLYGKLFDEDKIKLIQNGQEYLEQLQTHLNWLKEKEKKQ